MVASNRPDFGQDRLRQLAAPLAIGPVTLSNRVFLAPMSGVTDVPFRRLAAAAGAGMVVSEMVASDQLARGDREASVRAEAVATGPHVVQLAGCEARWMAEGARAAEAAGADIIDINMGCPAKKVTSGYSGSALMRDLDHALTLVEATVAATSRPVTLKMRLGWDERTINAPELARRAEAAGVRMITVHGRTRCQFYEGSADWAAVARVREAISVPLVVNGDIRSPDDANEAMARSGADAVMIGRGACGRPELPGEIARVAAGEPVGGADPGRTIALAVDHVAAILAHHGAAVGVRMARKHIGWYLDRLAVEGAPSPADHRALLLTETDPDRLLRRLESLPAQGERRAA